MTFLKCIFIDKKMADHSQEDLLGEIGKFLRYHDSLGIKEYPRTQILDHFLNKQPGTSPSPPKPQTQKSVRRVEKIPRRPWLRTRPIALDSTPKRQTGVRAGNDRPGLGGVACGGRITR